MIGRIFRTGQLAYHLLGQEHLPFRSLDEIRQIQARRVRRMVAHAYRTVPYYRATLDRLGLRPADFQSAEDLTQLPILERAELQRAPEHFTSRAQPLDRYIRLRSSGSTGVRCTVYHDLAALVQNAAHGERERIMIRHRIGAFGGYREATIAYPISSWRVVQNALQRGALLPPGIRIQRYYLSLFDPPETNLPLLNAFQPDILYTYGSYLDELFPYLHRTGKPFHRPKIIVYNSDAPSAVVRRLVQETFGIPVLGMYAAIEALKIGFECEAGLGLHLNVDCYPVRIVNAEGKDLPEGESGEVIISNLVNRATVLLQYRLGDLARILPGLCPCGRTLPVLSHLVGRTDDWIHLPSGRTIPPETIRWCIVQQEGYWQSQVIQTAPTELRVELVPVEGCDRDGLRRRILAAFAAAIGSEVRMEVAFVDTIKRTTGGKLRAVVALNSEQPGR